MISKTAAILTALLALGCQNPADRCELTESCPFPDFSGPDLATPQPKCAAAKGLTGDTLVCVDFDKISGLSDQAVKDWNFTPGGGCPGWEIASGKLQVKNFGTFVGTCSFTMPLTDLASAANQKYQSVTLAVVQKVEINTVPIVNKNQTTQVFLGLAMPTLQLSSYTGSNPRQQTTHAITRTELLTVRGDASFQPLFQLSSAAAFSGSGWQIESIAVMGNP